MIKKIWSFIMSVVMFLCALFGIDIGGGSGETGEMITCNDEKTIVTVSLDENPSTGYGWEYALSADGIVTLTADEYHPDETEPGVAGAGGVRSLSFAGVREGTVELTLSYQRAWEGDPIRTVVIRITVSADLHVTAALVSDDV